jgi:hypothetical protein
MACGATGARGRAPEHAGARVLPLASRQRVNDPPSTIDDPRSPWQLGGLAVKLPVGWGCAAGAGRTGDGLWRDAPATGICDLPSSIHDLLGGLGVLAVNLDLQDPLKPCGKLPPLVDSG